MSNSNVLTITHSDSRINYHTLS